MEMLSVTTWRLGRLPLRGSSAFLAPGRGLPDVTGPLGGAFLIPRPLAEEPHSQDEIARSPFSPHLPNLTQSAHQLASARKNCLRPNDSGLSARFQPDIKWGIPVQ